MSSIKYTVAVIGKYNVPVYFFTNHRSKDAARKKAKQMAKKHKIAPIGIFKILGDEKYKLLKNEIYNS